VGHISSVGVTVVNCTHIIVLIIQLITTTTSSYVKNASLLYHSETGMFDIIVVIVINWIMKTMKGQIVCASISFNHHTVLFIGFMPLL
jgi:hypothetical protein